MKKLWLLMLLFGSITLSLKAQEKIGCQTMEKAREDLLLYGRPENNATIERSLPGALVNCATYDIDSGYGSSGCTNDCTFTDNNPACTSNACGTATMGTYLVPCKVWVYADAGGTNRAATDAQIANHINYINTYHCCNGIPIRLYQIEAPTQVNNTDWNDCDNVGSSETGDDAAMVAANHTANILNIYIPNKLNDDGTTIGCNGYAALPNGFNTPNGNRMFMDGSCIRSTVTDVCANTQFAVVIIHELGHWLGLYHTHNGYESLQSPPGTRTECPDNSNDCTTGDFIADTDADPDLSSPCVTSSGCNPNPSGCTSPCATPYPADINTENNIMSYNNFSGCRQVYTPCQKAKMVDALVCARSYLCDPIENRFFTSTVVNNANSPFKEICAGGAIPTFTASNSTAASSIAGTCRFNWYTAASGGTPVATNTASFTPTSAQLNTSVIGTYYFYLAEVNAVNQNCRQRVQVTVLPDPGDGSPTTLNFRDNVTTPQTLSVTGASLSTNQYTGWIITTTNPAGTTNQAIYTAASGNTCSTPVTGTSVNCILKNASSAPTNSLSMDCNAGTTYYAIPFSSNYATAIPAASCTATATSTLVSLGATTGEWVRINGTQITCAPTPPRTPTFTLTLTVSGYTGSALTLNLRGNSACDLSANVLTANVGNGTFTYTEANFAPGFNPATSGICALFFQNGVSIDISVTATLNITYPAVPGITFPSITAIDQPCSYGTPITITCLEALDANLLTYTGKLTENNQTQLNWTTASEANNAYFTVEKSWNGTPYSFVGKVSGAGTTQVNQYYQLIDPKPQPGLNYYRLSQTDFDGTTRELGTVAIEYIKDISVVVVPNPTDQETAAVNIQYNTLSEGRVSIEVIDATGRRIQQQHVDAVRGANTFPLMVQDLPTGTYILRTTQGRAIEHTRFVRL